ncbi:SH3 domain-containing protein [Streptomyces azureus]|uniref:Membrane protein n=1 Tax=Streptomyces azureus TaxID=146537 RepID=A0A0K8PV67_STRAJ|nr:SH3 domain-containing protein [Streptomyces azureus]GAP51593.1 membrane protein [Streptomyces azureus]
MSLRSRLSIATAAGLLAAAAAVTPAAATHDDGDPSGGNGNHHDQNDPSGGNGNDHDPRLYEGVVTANTLALRSAPNRGSQIIRHAHKGDIVSIYCKTGGETVDGNPLWYLLTDGTWAWGAARYIDNIGPAPRWC